MTTSNNWVPAGSIFKQHDPVLDWVKNVTDNGYTVFLFDGVAEYTEDSIVNEYDIPSDMINLMHAGYLDEIAIVVNKIIDAAKDDEQDCKYAVVFKEPPSHFHSDPIDRMLTLGEECMIAKRAKCVLSDLVRRVVDNGGLTFVKSRVYANGEQHV